MQPSHSLSLISLLVSLAACADQSAAPAVLDNAGLHPAARPDGTADPTATFTFPNSGFSLQGDGLYLSGGNSVYANGVCGVSTRIFATTAGSNSGDATIQTGKARNCQRRFTLLYPDAVTEVVPSFNNLLQLQSTTFSILIGATVKRRLIVNPGAIANNPSRCGRLLFGPNGAVGAGSDSVDVTRTDASTWQVQSAGSHLAYCEAKDSLYAMPVSFVVVSSGPLP